MLPSPAPHLLAQKTEARPLLPGRPEWQMVTGFPRQATDAPSAPGGRTGRDTCQRALEPEVSVQQKPTGLVRNHMLTVSRDCLLKHMS